MERVAGSAIAERLLPGQVGWRPIAIKQYIIGLRLCQCPFKCLDCYGLGREKRAPKAGIGGGRQVICFVRDRSMGRRADQLLTEFPQHAPPKSGCTIRMGRIYRAHAMSRELSAAKIHFRASINPRSVTISQSSGGKSMKPGLAIGLVGILCLMALCSVSVHAQDTWTWPEKPKNVSRLVQRLGQPGGRVLKGGRSQECARELRKSAQT